MKDCLDESDWGKEGRQHELKKLIGKLTGTESVPKKIRCGMEAVREIAGGYLHNALSDDYSNLTRADFNLLCEAIKDVAQYRHELNNS